MNDWGHNNGRGRFGAHHERRFFSFLPMIILPFVPIVCFGLGIWQCRRLHWKVNLIEDIQDKLERAAMNLPRNVNIIEVPNFEYRKVQLAGVWDHAHSMLLGPKTHENVKGYQVITPLVRFDGGSTVLVNRGFVSSEALKNLAVLAKETGPVQLVALLRTSQTKNSFTPDNVPEKGEWYWVDVNAMADYAGGEARGVQPVYVEAIFDGNMGEASQLLASGEPVGRSVNIELRNMHLVYAITWFTLGIATGTLLFRMVRTRQQRIHQRIREMGYVDHMNRLTKPKPASSTSEASSQ